MYLDACSWAAQGVDRSRFVGPAEANIGKGLVWMGLRRGYDGKGGALWGSGKTAI